MVDQTKFAHLGPHYTKFLGLVRKSLSPERFFEIGTNAGQSLRLFDCDAVCVDPQFVINTNAILTRRRTFFFQMSSDAFFREYDPAHLLGGSIDVAFLDGFHLFEYLLRDLINTERCCRRSSVIILHDCLPPHPFMARRDDADGARIASDLGNPDLVRIHAAKPTDPPDPDGIPPAKKMMGWAGDVFRLIFILKTFRPDLRVTYFDAPPTGIVMLSNLDPSSNVLGERYFEAVDYAAQIRPDFERLEELYNLYPMVKTTTLDANGLSLLFPAFT